MRYLGWSSMVLAVVATVAWAEPDPPAPSPSPEPGESDAGVEGRLEGEFRIGPGVAEPEQEAAGGGRAMLALWASVAVNDYEDPTSDPVPYPVLQPILLASRRSCGEGNWYLQEGDHHYRFSLTSHAAGWRNGYRAGLAANAPLVTVATGAPAEAADLPESRSFLPFSAPTLALATMKKAETDDAVIVRVYDIEGRDTETELKLAVPVKEAVRTNIIEEPGVALKPAKGRFVLPVGHHAIETVRLVPEAPKKWCSGTRPAPRPPPP